MKKLISFLTALTLSCTGTILYSETAVCEDDAGSEPIKIMAIGDSITDGYGVAGSYRKFLYNELTKMGYSIDMVGSKGNNAKVEFYDDETGEKFTYDDDNTGYSGYAIKEYPGRNGILETLKATNCLETCKPDIVILQIGTNDVIDNYDMDNAYKRMEELCEYIYSQLSENSVLYVTSIPDVDPNRPEVYDWFSNYRHSADWQTMYSDEEAEENILKTLHVYNADALASAAHVYYKNSDFTIYPVEDENEHEEQGPFIRVGYIGDIITNVKTQLMDGVHPNNMGYKLMGVYWAEMIDSYLKTTKQQNENNETKFYNVSDLVKLQRYILGIPSGINYENFLTRYDVNEDDIVDAFDLITLRKILISSSYE